MMGAPAAKRNSWPSRAVLPKVVVVNCRGEWWIGPRTSLYSSRLKGVTIGCNLQRASVVLRLDKFEMRTISRELHRAHGFFVARRPRLACFVQQAHETQ